MPRAPVQWIRLYTSFARNVKTLMLRRMLGSADPLINLWCWAGENAQDGNLTQLEVADIELASDWKGEPGKAFSAMVETGFIDDNDSGTYLHDWMEGAGAGLERLEKTRAKMRNVMRERRASGVNDNAQANTTETGPTALGSTRAPDPDPDQISDQIYSHSNSVNDKTPLVLSLTPNTTPPSPLVYPWFPCDGTPPAWELHQEQIAAWQGIYPALDVEAQCKAAWAWVDSSPSKRKTATGMKRFLVGWLNRSQNSGKGRSWGGSATTPKAPKDW